MQHLLKAIAGAALTLLSCSSPGVSQTPSPERQRIGIALSGGGALGLAHIGVLRYFEEHHIPIDYVAGTSMGGLVGGFYATGIAPHELQVIVREADWDELLSANPRYQDEPVVEKQNWSRQTGTLTFRFGKKFALPAGLNPGQSLALLLSRHTAAYSNLESFDQLPTPFRCVATDLATGQAAVLDHGSLPKALRATMALPGIFTPVNWGDKVLIDGGIVDNLPVDVVRAMGATRVIAVTLEPDQPTAKQFTSLATVLRQTASIAVLQNERRSAEEADMVIHVHPGAISSSDYEQSEKLIQQGYEAAAAMQAELAPLQLSAQQWAEYVRSRQRRVRTLEQQGPLVAVKSPEPAVQRDASHELLRKLGSETVTEKQLEDVLSGVIAATGLPGAYYEWQDLPGRPQGYKVEFLERPEESVLLRPAFSAGLSDGEQSRAAFKQGLIFVPAGTYKSRLVSQLTVGYDPAAQGEYFRPFDGSPFFLSPGFLIERKHDALYQGPSRSNFFRDRFSGSLYAGIGTWRYSQLRLGVQTGFDSYSDSVAVDRVLNEDGPFLNPEAVWLLNKQDSGSLPTRGVRASAELGYSFRAHGFPYFKNDFSSFYPVSPRASVFLKERAGSSFGKKLDFFDQFTAGGEGGLEGYRYQEFHANSLAIAGAGLMIRGPMIKPLSVAPRLAVWYDAARLDLGSSGWQTHQSTSAGIFFPTAIGAAGAAVSFTESGKARLRLSLGSF